VPTLL